MNRKQANEFATEWIEAWNAHDIERILSYYADDFEMNSPVIAKRLAVPSGTLKGKAAVREYWQSALRAYPDLSFELLKVLHGVSWVTLYYLGATDKAVAETFLFDGNGKVTQVFASYA
ncbi:MAG: polyketide cyclase [Oceanospirillaceae bacterium]|nr:polyketide cyclase [Oceanospirillaceae bacterium]